MPIVRELFPLPGQLQLTLRRLMHQVLENRPGFENTIVLGIQPRGVVLARQLHTMLEAELGRPVLYGELDTTFHRDDFRRRPNPPTPSHTDVPVALEGLNVLLIDDVLYTGRTVRAALEAMLTFGRPATVELLALIDRRRLRDLPIEPSYVGMRIDTTDDENVVVEVGTMSASSVRIEAP